MKCRYAKGGVRVGQQHLLGSKKCGENLAQSVKPPRSVGSLCPAVDRKKEEEGGGGGGETGCSGGGEERERERFERTLAE